VKGDDLRQIMRRVPSAVTVVTAAVGDEARGITIGSFTSVSLNPPLISFNVWKQARMHDLLVRADSFIVHVLRADQARLSTLFADPDLDGDEQFRRAGTEIVGGSAPVIEGALATIYCRQHARYEAGDHTIVVGEVTGVRPGTGEPLLYYDRGYRAVGPEADQGA
jgi:flavin reductase (DIM6/NTAB) family NADH-FMN oxidoreductase RutF